MPHSLSMRRLVVMPLLLALPSCLPRLVVASPLVAPPLPLNAPAAASQGAVAPPCASTSTFRLPLVKNTPPVPGSLFFWMLDTSRQVDNDGSNDWFLVGWCAVRNPPALTIRNQVTNLIYASAQI
jgi:hypothetical protein